MLNAYSMVLSILFSLLFKVGHSHIISSNLLKSNSSIHTNHQFNLSSSQKNTFKSSPRRVFAGAYIGTGVLNFNNKLNAFKIPPCAFYSIKVNLAANISNHAVIGFNIQNSNARINQSKLKNSVESYFKQSNLNSNLSFIRNPFLSMYSLGVFGAYHLPRRHHLHAFVFGLNYNISQLFINARILNSSSNSTWNEVIHLSDTMNRTSFLPSLGYNYHLRLSTSIHFVCGVEYALHITRSRYVDIVDHSIPNQYALKEFRFPSPSNQFSCFIGFTFRSIDHIKPNEKQYDKLNHLERDY